ncbi:MAG: hypothetical protein PHP45_00250 [Elusimicrobiales bacterium]|nr:hypothetical protein [Elusimicrobiales bacterium]
MKTIVNVLARYVIAAAIVAGTYVAVSSAQQGAGTAIMAPGAYRGALDNCKADVGNCTHEFHSKMLQGLRSGKCDLGLMESALKGGADPNALISDMGGRYNNYTLLQVVAGLHPNMKAVALLLKYDAKVDIAAHRYDGEGGTAIDIARRFLAESIMGKKSEKEIRVREAIVGLLESASAK